MTRGYITIATGPRVFVEMAVNLALSIRKFDPEKPVCLVHDQSIDQLAPEARHLFDHYVDARDIADKAIIANLNKLLLDRLSPFEETIYIDADCLIVKPDMDRHWEKMAAEPFNIAGDKRSRGAWHGLDIADVCKTLDVAHIVQMNSGVVYFNKSEQARAVFDAARALFRDRRDALAARRKNYNNRYADEPFLGAAMGVAGVEPASYVPEEGSIMITTLYAKNVRFDLEKGAARIDKPAGFRIAGRLWAKGWVRHSPTIAHFIKLKPRGVYQKLSDRLREGAGLSCFQFPRKL